MNPAAATKKKFAGSVKVKATVAGVIIAIVTLKAYWTPAGIVCPNCGHIFWTRLTGSPAGVSWIACNWATCPARGKVYAYPSLALQLTPTGVTVQNATAIPLGWHAAPDVISNG